MADAMSLEDALDHIARCKAGLVDREWNLFIRVYNPGTVGGAPAVPLTAINFGFDWDAGRILLESDVMLTSLSAEDVAAIRDSVAKGSSWHAYKAWEKQQLRIKELEAELAGRVAAASVPGFAKVPLKLTRAMEEVIQGDDWQWEDLLAAAEAIGEEQYEAIAATSAPSNELQRSEIRHANFVMDLCRVMDGEKTLNDFPEIKRLEEMFTASPAVVRQPAPDWMLGDALFSQKALRLALAECRKSQHGMYETALDAITCIVEHLRAAPDAPTEAAPALPPPALTWLFTHCRAIGMTKHSDSGKWEHDIALFTTDLQNRIKELEAAPALIPYNKATKHILGMLCFQVARFAHAFKAAGADIESSAEDEQAFILHKFLNLYLVHGDAWADEADKEIRAALHEAERRAVLAASSAKE